jgi:diguanylate cyclase (GGDEF)-like protein
MLFKRKKLLDMYQQAFNGAENAIWDWRSGKPEIHITPEWWDLTGVPAGADSIDFAEWFDGIHIDDQKSVKECLYRYDLSHSESSRFEYRYKNKNGEIIWLLFNGRINHGYDGQLKRVIGLVTNITEHKRFSEETGFLAYNDSLTKLPNRVYLQDTIQQLLNLMRRDAGFGFTLLYLDLDGFKMVNDSYGHRVGDRLLVILADRFVNAVRSMDTVARVGGDEFIILLNGITDPETIEKVADRLLLSTRRSLIIDKSKIEISVSIGIENSITRDSVPERIIQNADRAMYAVKSAGKGHYRYFRADVFQKNDNRWQMEEELKKSIQNKELELHFQPVYNLETGEIHSLEALLRWIHPLRGPIPPSEFIPIAEDIDFVSSLTEWVITETCKTAVSMKGTRNRHLTFDINISAKDFLMKKGLTNLITGILKDTGCDPQRIAIEVTEGAIISHYESAITQLEELRKVGIQIKLDDFGTGYSSLSYLASFPIDILKIDQSFTRNMMNNEMSRQLTKSIIGLAHNMSLQVVVEGVELTEQLEYLYAWDCDFVQGFLYSPPIEAGKLNDFLDALPKRPMA